MRRAAVVGVLTAVVLALVPAGAGAVLDELPPGIEVGARRDDRPREVIVGFERGASASVRRQARDRAGVELDRRLLLPRVQVVDVDGSIDVALARLERQPGVRFAVPNVPVRALAAPPNDPLFPRLWGLRNTGQPASDGDGNPLTGAPGADVNVLAAWDTTRGVGQVVAVLDTGIDLTHPDIAPNLWTNPGEIPDNGADDDGNGKVDDVHGYDFAAPALDGHAAPDADPDDYDSHGTHVAGTIAAAANNGEGVAGVAPEARLMAVRVLDGDGAGGLDAVIDGIAYAADEGASVINLSLGVKPDLADAAGVADALGAAVAHAAARGAVVVAAAGNDGTDNDAHPVYPCSLPHENLICVAAIDATGAFDASYSNHGATSVDVAAPGTGIVSAVPAYAVVFSEDFDGGLAAWTSGTWGIEPAGVPVLANAASDSPGTRYPDGVADERALTPTVAARTDGERGCRLAYLVRLQIQGGDQLWVDAVGAGATLELLTASGGDGRAFYGFDHSIERLAGHAVRPVFTLVTNGDGLNGDGAYIDEVEVRCRTSAHGDDEYALLTGTSMATPHVAGVAALVRAAAPWASAEQVVAAVKAGAVPDHQLGDKVATGGRVDAARAIAAAPTPPAPPPPPPPSPPSPPAVVEPARRAACAGLRGRRLATCRLARRVQRACGRLERGRKRVCIRRERAIARCRAMPTRGRKAKARRAACLRGAKAIGKRPAAGRRR